NRRTRRPKPAGIVTQSGKRRLGGAHAPPMMRGGPLGITPCGGFLLAVLWMDLIFDSQVLAHRHSPDPLPEPVLASIAGYYHRATTSSRPMSTLIALVMMILLIMLAVWAIFGNDPGWFVSVSAALAGIPILLALIRT